MRNVNWLLGLVVAVCLLAGCATQDKTGQAQGKSGHNPKAAALNVQLGIGYLAQDQKPRAKTKLLLALQQDPNSHVVNDAMGYFYESTGDFIRAKEYYARAIQLAPSQGAPYNNYGAFLCRRGQFKLADSYFMKAVAIPDYTKVAEAYENAGLCALRIPNKQQAKSFFVSAVEHDGQRAISFENLAIIAFHEKKYRQAKRYLSAYLKLEVLTPTTALLGYQIALKEQDKQAVMRYGRLLTSKFSRSKAYLAYKNNKGMR